MDKAVEVTREDFAAIRTGRAHPQMFHKINADYYGSPTPLQQLASFTVPEARVIIISPYDHGAMGAIERAIRDSDLGVNPTDDGKTIRVVLPELTEDRRKDYIKLARQKAEEGRVSVRNIRRNAKQSLDRLEKDGDRKSTRLNSSHANISYAVFCLKKKKHSTCRARSGTSSSRLPLSSL